MAIVETTRSITGGVDTHLDTHVVAALDPNGGVLGVAAFPATRSGYCSLSSWLGEFGTIARIGVEGTGAYGAGLARHLRSLGVEVIEVDRPNRQLRRAQGKSDTIDAIDAARAVLSGRATGVAKTADGNVEAMRALLIAKRSGREARITCLNQVRHLGFTAPDELRERFQRVSRGTLAAQAAALRPRPDSDAVLYATKLAMRSLGRRVLGIDEEIARLEVVLGELVTATAPVWWASTASVSTPPPSSVSPPATIPSECAAKPPGRTCAVSHPSRQPPARSPAGTGSTEAATAKPTMPCGASCSPASAPIPAPAPTSPVASTKDGRDPRSSAASSVTSPDRPTDTSPADRSAAAGLAPELPDPAPRCVLRSTCRPVAAHPSGVALA